MGCLLDALVYDVSGSGRQRRIGLTTYPQEDWEAKLPARIDRDDTYRRNEMLGEDGEGYEAFRAANLAALERTMALTLDDDDDDDDYDDDDEEEEEIPVTNQQRLGKKVLIDDFAAAGIIGDDVQGPAYSRLKTESDDTFDTGEEIDSEDIFNEIVGYKGSVTLADITKKWDFVSTLLKDGDVTQEQLQELFTEAAGGDGGRLDMEGFDAFIDLLVDELDLEEVGGDADQAMADGAEGDLSFDAAPSQPILLVGGSDENDEDDEDDEEFLTIDINDDDDFSDFEDLEVKKSKRSSSPPSSSSARGFGGDSLENLYEKRSKNEELLGYVFRSVSKGRDTVSMADVLAWDFVKALLEAGNGGITAEMVRKVFTESVSNTKKGLMTTTEFEGFVTALSEFETKKKNDGVVEIENVRSKVSTGIIPTVSDNEGDGEADDDADLSSAVKEAFVTLSAGEAFASYDSVRQWDIIAELVDEGVVTEAELKGYFIDAGGKKRGLGKALSIDEKGLETLLNILEPIALDSMEEEEEEEEEELLRDVFERISNGKAFISAKDLMNWDLVLDLMAEGLLSEELLAEIMLSVGGDKKGVRLDGFDRLVDMLVDKYKQIEDDEDDASASVDEESSIDGMLEETGTADLLRRQIDKQLSLTGEYNMFQNEASEPALSAMSEEMLDIDTEVIFKDMSGGADVISVRQLRDWELMRDMLSSGQMGEEEFLDILECAGVEGSEESASIDIALFDAILDEFSERSD